MGLDTRAIIQGAGLSKQELEDPDALIPREKVMAAWTLSYELNDDADLALHAAENIEMGAYKVIDFLGANAPTIGTALERIAKYFPLVDDLVLLEAIPERSQFLFRMSAPDLPVSLPRPAVEYTLAAVYLRIRKSAGTAFPLVRADFSFARPASTDEHKRIFDCETHFDQPFSQLVISQEVYQRPTPKSDPALFAVLDDHADLLLDKHPQQQGWVGRVRETVASEMGRGEITMAQIARSLGMGERTLQRRLGEEDTSFASLLDDERHKSAEKLLKEPGVSLAETAFLLGFSDQSAFSRAFTRWTGMPPGKWRRKLD